jgi:hypothetical protein
MVFILVFKLAGRYLVLLCMRVRCPYTEEQVRLFETYENDPGSLRTPVRKETKRLLPDYHRYRAMRSRLPESRPWISDADYKRERALAEKPPKTDRVFLRPLDHDYWYFYPTQARKCFDAEANTGKLRVQAAILAHAVGWNIWGKYKGPASRWDQTHIWYPRSLLAEKMGMTPAQVRQATDCAVAFGLLESPVSEHNYGGNRVLFYGMAGTDDFFAHRNKLVQYRVRVSVAKEHGFAAACILELYTHFTRRWLETLDPGPDGLAWHYDSFANFDRIFDGVFTRQEIYKGMARLVRGGLLLKKINPQEAGTKHVNYSLPAEVIRELQANKIILDPELEGLSLPPDVEKEIEKEINQELARSLPHATDLDAVLVEPKPRQPNRPVILNPTVREVMLDPEGSNMTLEELLASPLSEDDFDARLAPNRKVIFNRLPTLDELDNPLVLAAYQRGDCKALIDKAVEELQAAVAKRTHFYPESQTVLPESQIHVQKNSLPEIEPGGLASLGLRPDFDSTYRKSGPTEPVAAEPLPSETPTVRDREQATASQGPGLATPTKNTDQDRRPGLAAQAQKTTTQNSGTGPGNPQPVQGPGLATQTQETTTQDCGRRPGLATPTQKATQDSGTGPGNASPGFSQPTAAQPPPDPDESPAEERYL